MKEHIGKYVFTTWTHNSGFRQQWLRHINRVTKHYLCSDVQHTLALGDKWKKKYDKGSDYYYVIHKPWAKRFRFVDGNLVREGSHRNNTDGQFTAEFVEDFSSLKCKYAFSELFNTNILDNVPEGRYRDRIIKRADELAERFKVDSSKFTNMGVEMIAPDDDVYGHTASHLMKLLGVSKVAKVQSFYIQLDTTHHQSKYTETATHYHIIEQPNKSPISFKEHYRDQTISFWLFDDLVVFKLEDGIDTW